MKGIFILLGAFIALSCLNLKVYSQDEESSSSDEPGMSMDDLFDLSLEELLNIELETGSFLSLDLKSSSVSMTIISAEQLETSGARDLTEALEIYVPGFQYLINRWNGIIWGMRGVANDRNTKFIFLVNGHKMNAESRDGAITELDLGILDDVERIEVLRGPAGLVYGSGAIAGVINVVTKEFAKTSASASVKYHTWDSEHDGAEVQASGSVKINEDASVRIDIGHRQSDGIGNERSLLWGAPDWPYHLTYNREDSAVIAGGLPTLSSAKSTPGNYKLAADIKYKKLRVYTRYTDQTTNSGGLYYRREGSENYNRAYVYKNLSNQATYSLPVGENEILFRGGFDANTNRIAVLYPDSVGIEETFGERRYNVSATYVYTSRDKFQFAAGYEFRLYDIGNDIEGKNEMFGNPLHLVVADVTYNYHSLFSEGIYDLTDKVSAHFGVRYDIHTRTAQHGGVINPKLGVVYKPADRHSLKLVFQQSANNGTADSYEHNRYSIRPDGVVMDYDYYTNPTATNPWDLKKGASDEELHNLKPEKTQSIELMTYHQFTDNFIVMPSVSYNSVTGLFVWENSKLYRMVNAGDYNFMNIDFDVQYSGDKIVVGANHTMQQLAGMDIKEQAYSEVMQKYSGGTPVEGLDGEQYYIPKAIEGVDTLHFNSIRDGITLDGKNFINLNTHTTKLYADIKPYKFLTFHTSARIFWGLKGRTPIYEYDHEAHQEAMESDNPSDIDVALDPFAGEMKTMDEYHFYDSHVKASIKMNLGLTFKKVGFPLKASIHAYDILAGAVDATNVHNLRNSPSLVSYAVGIHGVDYRSYAFKLTYQL